MKTESTVNDLVNLCKLEGITGYSKYRRKQDLINFILQNIFGTFDDSLFETQEVKCDICGHYYKLSFKPQHLRSNKHILAEIRDKVQVIETAFESRLITYFISNFDNIYDPMEFLESLKRIVIALIREQLENKNLKVNL